MNCGKHNFYTKYNYVFENDKIFFQRKWNCISGVMVSMFAFSAVDNGFEVDLVKPKIIKLVLAASPLSTHSFKE